MTHFGRTSSRSQVLNKKNWSPVQKSHFEKSLHISSLQLHSKRDSSTDILKYHFWNFSGQLFSTVSSGCIQAKISTNYILPLVQIPKLNKMTVTYTFLTDNFIQNNLKSRKILKSITPGTSCLLVLHYLSLERLACQSCII